MPHEVPAGPHHSMGLGHVGLPRHLLPEPSTDSASASVLTPTLAVPRIASPAPGSSIQQALTDAP